MMPSPSDVRAELDLPVDGGTAVEGEEEIELQPARYGPRLEALFQRFPALERLGEPLRRRVVPVRQSVTTECGAASLAMILNYHGRLVRLDEVRDALGIGRDGATALSLIDAAERYGLRGRGVKVGDQDEELEYLSAMGLPAILFWQFNHFVVFERIEGDEVHLVDPAVGRAVVTRAEFRKAFTGVALLFEPTESFRPERAPRRGLRRFLGLVLEEARLLPRIAVVSLLLQLLVLAVPKLTGVLVDKVIPRADRHLLLVLVVGMSAIAVFHVLASLVRFQLLAQLRALLDTKLTVGFLEHLFDLPFSFFALRSSGDLLNRVYSVSAIRESLSSTVASTMIDGALVVTYLGVILGTSPNVAALVVAIGLFQLALFWRTRRVQTLLFARTLDAQARSQGQLIQALSGIELLKSSGTERRALARWSDYFVDELNTEIERTRLTGGLEAMLGALRTISPLVILSYGATQVMIGRLTLGELIALGALAQGFLAPLAALVGSLSQLHRIQLHSSRVADVVETPREVEGRAQTPPGTLRGAVTLDEVSFRYAPSAPLVVQDVSLEVAPGQVVAIVGRSGCGKSTLARLLAGLYPPTAGRVLFDGKDLAGLDPRATRAQLGIVTQDSHLFGVSVRENILLADPSVPRSRMREAAELACIDDEIQRMPMGYETIIGDNGVALSGGQRQRLALARALVTRPAVLILDEATSALDAVTEARVHENLRRIACTRIVIAHRLSTVRHADLIIVMHEGRAVEHGTHDDLCAAGGRYAELVAAQHSRGEVG